LPKSNRLNLFLGGLLKNRLDNYITRYYGLDARMRGRIVRKALGEWLDRHENDDDPLPEEYFEAGYKKEKGKTHLTTMTFHRCFRNTFEPFV